MRVKFLHEAIAGPHSGDDIQRIRVEFIKDVLLHKMMFDILR